MIVFKGYEYLVNKNAIFIYAIGLIYSIIVGTLYVGIFALFYINVEIARKRRSHEPIIKDLYNS